MTLERGPNSMTTNDYNAVESKRNAGLKVVHPLRLSPSPSMAQQSLSLRGNAASGVVLP
jgi:hypothetical protein